MIPPAEQDAHVLCRRLNETGPPLCTCPESTCAIGATSTGHALAARIAEGWTPPVAAAREAGTP